MAKYNTHKTYINDEGIEVPSATTILKLLNKPALQKWANIMGFKRVNTDDVLKKAGEIGTATHLCIENYLLQNKEFRLPEEYMKHILTITDRFKGFKKFLEGKEIVPIYMEKELVSKKYGGTVDFYGIYEGKKSVLDWKTSSKVYSSMFLQMAAYTLELEAQGEEVEGAGIVHITEKGTNIHYKTRQELQPYIDGWIMLVNFFHLWYDLNESDKWGTIL